MFSYPIKQGIRQVERWIIAAKQDAHAGVKLLHANYAVGNLDMLRQQFTDEEIKRETGKDPQKLLMIATQLQDEAQKELVLLCPKIIPE